MVDGLELVAVNGITLYGSISVLSGYIRSEYDDLFTCSGVTYAKCTSLTKMLISQLAQ